MLPGRVTFCSTEEGVIRFDGEGIAAQRRYDGIRLSSVYYDAVASLAKYLGEGTEP